MMAFGARRLPMMLQVACLISIALGLAADAPALANVPSPVVVSSAREPSTAQKLRLPAPLAAQAGTTVGLLRHESFALALARYFSFVGIIKALCMVSNLFQQLSLLPVVTQIKKLKSTGDVDALPMVSLFLMGFQWMSYGLFATVETGDHKFLILVYANLGALSLGAYYTFSFYCNCDNTKSGQMLQFYLSCGLAVFLVQGTVILVRPSSTALFFSGAMSSCLSILVGASPLASLGQVFRTRSLASMPVEMVLVNVVGNALWITCGLIIWDPWLLLCNAVQLLFGFGFLAVILRLHPSTQKLFPDTWQLGQVKYSESKEADSFNLKEKRLSEYGTLGRQGRPIATQHVQHAAPVPLKGAGSTGGTDDV